MFSCRFSYLHSSLQCCAPFPSEYFVKLEDAHSLSGFCRRVQVEKNIGKVLNYSRKNYSPSTFLKNMFDFALHRGMCLEKIWFISRSLVRSLKILTVHHNLRFLSPRTSYGIDPSSWKSSHGARASLTQRLDVQMPPSR